ncbi:MAG: hypothetical protein ABI383_09260 [Acidobacteriaceae bacterium]
MKCKLVRTAVLGITAIAMGVPLAQNAAAQNAYSPNTYFGDTAKSIAIIGGATVGGAAVGGMLGGKRGALVGATAGAGAGYAVDRYRRQREYSQYYSNDGEYYPSAEKGYAQPGQGDNYPDGRPYYRGRPQ